MASDILRRETIVALSSGAGRAAVAIIRVSGEQTRFVLETMAAPCPPARRASLRTLVDGAGVALDEALVLFFPSPHSYSGEDMAEFQVHGGRAVVQGVLDALLALPGLRLAEPGEFTRRALDNERLDLTRVEGIADLIDAETPRQRRQALAQAGGALARKVQAWRGLVIEAMAELEAELDFSDEADVDDGGRLRAAELLRELEQDLGVVLADGRRGERVRDGMTVVIAGPPNAGKSTLLNAMARRDVAIVTDIPGTTRDLLDVHLDLDGYPVTLVDTAGIRETSETVEAIGIRRAGDRAREADLVLWLCPPDVTAEPPADWPNVWIVASKIDSGPTTIGRPDMGVSARTGEGLADLERAIRREADTLLGGDTALVTRVRHRDGMETALRFVRQALVSLNNGRGAEMVAEDCRLAGRALGVVIGLVDVNDVLGRVFAQFCIGK